MGEYFEMSSDEDGSNFGSSSAISTSYKSKSIIMAPQTQVRVHDDQVLQKGDHTLFTLRSNSIFDYMKMKDMEE